MKTCVKKASGMVRRKSSSLSVMLHVIRRKNTSSGSAKQLKLVGLILRSSLKNEDMIVECESIATPLQVLKLNNTLCTCNH